MSSFDRAIEILTQGDRHRVWSLIVTIFGDLARERGDEIPVQTLAMLTEPIGVKSEALRVALHRLRKEGWLESKRLGRSSAYFLTEHGLQQTAAATPRIYAMTSPAKSDWRLFSTQLGTEKTDGLKWTDDCVRLNTTTFLGPRNLAPLDTLISDLDHSEIPEWVKQQIISEAICEEYRNLTFTLGEVSGVIEKSQSKVQSAILRTLIVHSWRRILLRHPDVPDEFFPSNCDAVACRTVYLELLTHLPRPAITDLSDN